MDAATQEQLWQQPDWTCTHCAFVNKAIRSVCRNCEAPNQAHPRWQATPGPWHYAGANTVVALGGRPNEPALVAKVSSAHEEADAQLMAQAPAMDLMLCLIRENIAWFNPVTGEFCFDSLRYTTEDRNWTGVLDIIGWDRARAALAKVEAQRC